MHVKSLPDFTEEQNKNNKTDELYFADLILDPGECPTNEKKRLITTYDSDIRQDTGRCIPPSNAHHPLMHRLGIDDPRLYHY